MKKLVRNICVDSGTILISDESFYEKWNGKILDEDKEFFKKYKLENGQYEIEWKINQTYMGKVSGTRFSNFGFYGW